MKSALYALALLTAGATPLQAQTARILPERPFVERTEAGQAAAFDIALTNNTAEALTLTELEITFLDAQGRTLMVRRLDGNGSAPSIQTVPNREIAPGADRLVFNPFDTLPDDLAVASVSARATLSSEDGEDRLVSAGATLTPADGRKYRLPLTGRVLVWDGHDGLSHHRRWDYLLPGLAAFGFRSNAMRYSYDFVPVDDQGRMHVGDGERNEDWFGFGQPVRAPEAGVVVQVRDDRPDDRAFDPAVLSEDINLVCGNLVVIRHDDGTFSMLGHIRQGSARVVVGDRVRAGQEVAAVGASGSSLFPHLHYQRVDAADMHGEGVPSAFRDLLLVRGAARRAPEHGHIDSGDVVMAR